MRVTLPENTIFYNEVKQSIKSIWIFYSLKRCSISCHLKKKKKIWLFSLLYDDWIPLKEINVYKILYLPI